MSEPRRELLDSVWPGAFIEPQAVKKQIFDLRRALDDPPRDPRFIETLPRRGYRFIATVEDTAPRPPAVSALPLSRRLVGGHAPEEPGPAPLRSATSRGPGVSTSTVPLTWSTSMIHKPWPVGHEARTIYDIAEKDLIQSEHPVVEAPRFAEQQLQREDESLLDIGDGDFPSDSATETSYRRASLEYNLAVLRHADELLDTGGAAKHVNQPEVRSLIRDTILWIERQLREAS